MQTTVKDDSTQDTKFLTHDGKNHIILCFRYASELLDTVAKPTPEESA